MRRAAARGRSFYQNRSSGAGFTSPFFILLAEIKIMTTSDAVLALAIFVSTEALAADIGRDLSANCAACHGTQGRSTGAMPQLAGIERAYFVRQMQDFRSGKRPATIMHQIAKGYSESQVAAMADYFSAQSAESTDVGHQK